MFAYIHFVHETWASIHIFNWKTPTLVVCWLSDINLFCVKTEFTAKEFVFITFLLFVIFSCEFWITFGDTIRWGYYTVTYFLNDKNPWKNYNTFLIKCQSSLPVLFGGKLIFELGDIESEISCTLSKALVDNCFSRWKSTSGHRPPEMITK